MKAKVLLVIFIFGMFCAAMLISFVVYVSKILP